MAWNGSAGAPQITAPASTPDARHLSAPGVIVNDNVGRTAYVSGWSSLPPQRCTPRLGDVAVKYTDYGEQISTASRMANRLLAESMRFISGGTLDRLYNGTSPNYDG